MKLTISSTFLRHITLKLFLSIFISCQLLTISAHQPGAAPTASGISARQQAVNFPPVASAGPDFTIGVGVPAVFYGQGASPDADMARYAWDFDGDRVFDFESETTGTTSHIFLNAGAYTSTLTVTDMLGNSSADTVEVTVTPGSSRQAYKDTSPVAQVGVSQLAGDGVENHYVLMLNGAGESRFWYDVTFMYSTLTQDYHYSPGEIYLLNHNGADPWGNNPEVMIDRQATFADLDATFNELAGLVDGDDHLFIWVTDHGYGYMGPHIPMTYGFLSSHASVDPGDEQDYLEHDFKLRALYTGGDYGGNHGMDVFRVYSAHYYYPEPVQYYYRHKYVSRFTDLFFEEMGIQSNADIEIEELLDYLVGDTDKDRKIEETQGEKLDYDGDGILPYDPTTGTYDEDDWGNLDEFIDQENNTWLNTIVPGESPYRVFDAGFDNRIDIDLNYDYITLEVDGTDLDNQGLFDGLNVNDDGDLDDWVSIDEKLYLYNSEIIDDQFSEMVDRIGARAISFFMLPCYSGGFVDDLSAPNRVISTATEEETESWGNLFANLFTSSLHGRTREEVPVNADADGNHRISMLEAFNYAAGNDFYDEIPQYDDNGDGISHPFQVPSEGDGDFGADIYLSPPVFYLPLIVR